MFTLSLALCPQVLPHGHRDPAVQKHFQDGVYILTLTKHNQSPEELLQLLAQYAFCAVWSQSIWASASAACLDVREPL